MSKKSADFTLGYGLSRSFLLNIHIWHSDHEQLPVLIRMTRYVKLNYKGVKKYKAESWKSDECQNLDSEEHLLWCKGYEEIREHWNLENEKELSSYIQKIVQKNEAKKTNKHYEIPIFGSRELHCARWPLHGGDWARHGKGWCLQLQDGRVISV